MRFVLAVVFLFTLCEKAVAFSDFDVCDHCYTTAQFAHAAEQHSLATRPLMASGIDPVYVVNASSGEVRYFDVYRSVSGNLLGDGDEPEMVSQFGSAIPATSGGSVSSGYYLAEALEGAPDPEILEVLEEAHAVLQIAIETWSQQAIRSDEVPGLEDLQSALQLVGPESAEFWRNQVGVALEDYMNAQIASRVGTIISDAILGAYQKFVAASMLPEGFEIVLQAPDGTEIRITYTLNMRVGELSDGYNFDIMEETVRVTGQPIGFPTTPGGFSGYTYTGSFVTASQLRLLADRLGVGGGCSWSCSASDHCALSCSTN